MREDVLQELVSLAFFQLLRVIKSHLAYGLIFTSRPIFPSIILRLWEDSSPAPFPSHTPHHTTPHSHTHQKAAQYTNEPKTGPRPASSIPDSISISISISTGTFMTVIHILIANKLNTHLQWYRHLYNCQVHASLANPDSSRGYYCCTCSQKFLPRKE